MTTIDPADRLEAALAEEAVIAAERAVPGFVADSVRPYVRVRRRSAVYWVSDAGGRALAVKRQVADASSLEARVYRDVLAAVGADTITCHGTYPSWDDGWSWLVIDHADGPAIDVRDPSHAAALGCWVGQVHVRASRLTVLGELPRLDAAHWWSRLDGACTVLDVAMANPAVGAEGHRWVSDLRKTLARVAGTWVEFVALIDQLPVTLVHGDLSHRNVRMPGRGRTLRPAVLDWETAGHGSPMVDLAWVDLAAYRDAVAAESAGAVLIDLADLRCLQTLATLTWISFVLLGERASLASSWPHRSLRKIEHYLGLVDPVRLDELADAGAPR